MVNCDGPCREWYHRSCLYVTKWEVGVIESKEDVIWLCHKCAADLTVSQKGLQKKLGKGPLMASGDDKDK